MTSPTPDLRGEPADPPDGSPIGRTDSFPPTPSAAWARIDCVRPEDYARTRNRLDGAVTGLSPYLTHGLVTLPDVLGGVLKKGPLPVQHKLVFELGWREYFRHAWFDAGDRILDSLHPGPRPDSTYDPVLPADIRQARTGVPVIDQAVRTLYATGYLHNHARMWLASYVVHLRQVHWRAGADWLVAHLLDGDLASNHLSWQWVAGTASHKPYLFNAENVALHAPPPYTNWHSPGSVVDQPYEALERIARGGARPTDASPGVSGPGDGRLAAAPAGRCEPALHPTPPADLGLQAPDADSLALLRGREVWLVHPWALRVPPADLPPDAVVVGVYLREHHRAWPWPEARWRWVDAAMAAITPTRWHVDAPGLADALARAGRVRSVDDPHISPWLRPLAQLEPTPTLFPPVERACTSFSQWWTRTTCGLQQAQELL